MPGAGGSQTPEVLHGIFAISTLVPGVGFALLALVLALWYPLHKKQVDENVARLRSRHEKEGGQQE